MKALFVTNFCPHYHVKLFEMLASTMDVEFLFTSRGQEWYWDPRHGIRGGAFHHEYLGSAGKGSSLTTACTLFERVRVSSADVVFCSLAGRLPPLVTFLATRAKGKPFVLWTGIWMHPKTAFHRISFPLLRWIYRGSSALLVYGSHVRDYLVGLGIPAAKIFVANHALDNQVYGAPVAPSDLEALRVRHGLRGRKVILFVGRLTASKGVEHLIEAVGRIRDLEPVLVVVGEGDLKVRLNGLAEARRVTARFVGYVPTEELYKYYAMADVFVLPSITTKGGREPWGLVVNEAMNQGTPVVASTAVGAAAGGLVRHGETGLVLPEGNVAALAAALQNLLENPAQCAQLGDAGRREIALWNNTRLVEAFVAAAEYCQGR